MRGQTGKSHQVLAGVGPCILADKSLSGGDLVLGDKSLTLRSFPFLALVWLVHLIISGKECSQESLVIHQEEISQSLCCLLQHKNWPFLSTYHRQNAKIALLSVYTKRVVLKARKRLSFESR